MYPRARQSLKLVQTPRVSNSEDEPTARTSETPVVQGDPPAQEHPTKVDIWSTRLAAWAQIVTVFVVIFGYFYTCTPGISAAIASGTNGPIAVRQRLS